MNASRHVNPTVFDPLSSALSELKMTQQELSDLYYAVSHDLRSPLRSIVGFCKALAEDVGEQIPEAQKDYLFRIVTNATKLDAMIIALLFLSRIPTMPVKISPVDMSRLVSDTLAMYQQRQPQKGVRQRIERGIVIDTDIDLVSKVIENLTENSCRFSRDDVPLEIGFGIDRDGPPGTFFFRDNGIGFDMEFADRLFTPFQKLHPASVSPGLGVGLAIVHRIVRHLKGEVWAHSKPKEGTTIGFFLPQGQIDERR